MVGGLVGRASRSISIARNHSNASIVSGTDHVGGIVGESTATSSRNNQICSNVSLNGNIVSSGSNVGRIYGSANSYTSVGTVGTVEANRALLTTKINGVDVDLEDSEQNGQNTGLGTLKYKATYQGLGWDFGATWNIQETESFPYLAGQTAPPVIDGVPVSGGTVISGKSVDGGTISGLWANGTDDNAGLFAVIDGGSVQNLTVNVAEGKQVKGGSYVGVMAGQVKSGSITGCRVSGDVEGMMNVGGLIGHLEASNISRCYSSGSVTAADTKASYAGGLVGVNGTSATIADCYSDASVTSVTYAAGLVGYNYGSVSNCFARRCT